MGQSNKSAEEIFILKKDWPPFPKGTEFKTKMGLTDKMLYSPGFGDKMPNGQIAKGMIPRHWTEYVKHFDFVGGFDEWFDKKFKTKEEELQSRITALEEENARLSEALGLSNAWPVTDILNKLSESAEYLLNVMNYDRQGWEDVSHCAKIGREMSINILKALTPKSEGNG